MVKIIIAFTILAGSLYVAFAAVDFLLKLWRILPQPTIVDNPSKKEQIIEAFLESLNIWELSSNPSAAINSVSSCEIEVGAACSEVVANVEGLESGVSAIVESTGEHLVTAIENISNF